MRKDIILVCVSKIKDVLEREGITPSEASRRIGASSDYLGDIMRAAYNGFARISRNRLVKFCEEFNADFDDMTKRKYKPKNQDPQPQGPEMTSVQAFYNLTASLIAALTDFQHNLMEIKEK